MKKIKEKHPWINWVSLFLMVVLSIHFIFSIAYSFIPENRWLMRYMEPLFTQNFKIFAPNVPETESSFFISYHTMDQGWSNWQAVGLKDRNLVQNNPFSTHRVPLLISQHTLHNLHYIVETACYYHKAHQIKSTTLVNCNANEIKHLPEYKEVQKYCIDYLSKQISTTSPIKFKCCLVTSPISDKKRKVALFNSANTKFAYIYFHQPYPAH